MVLFSEKRTVPFLGFGNLNSSKPEIAIKQNQYNIFDMRLNIKNVISEMEMFVEGWRKYAAEKQLSSLTLAAVEAELSVLVEHEREMRLAKLEYRGKIAPRTSMGLCLRDKRRRLIAAVKSDVTLGENSAFWRFLGFKTLEELRGSQGSGPKDGSSDHADGNPDTESSDDEHPPDGQ